MAYLRYGLATIVALAFVIVAFANRAIVEVKLLPDALASLAGTNISLSLPLFLILGLAVGSGLLLGFIWEWFREQQYRAEAAQLRRENAAMASELKRAAEESPRVRKDEILALVDSK